MATTLQTAPQQSALITPASAPKGTATNGQTTSVKNPQLKRIVYSKYRELLGSYNDKANAIIDTLPAYMVHEDRGFNFVDMKSDGTNSTTSLTSNNGTDYGQRGGSGGYEAPACVQNAMMTKDKKPFTYTPGGIDLSQIKSERMAKRLARNAQAEGATGASQQNRPAQPQSPNGRAAAAMGAAALGMPFQVLPPPPPPPQPQAQSPLAPGKKATNGNTAPPPPPPQSTLAPPSAANGRATSPGSPNAARKSPSPQHFEPPPLGFRPEIKIPPNPMAALRKVPPPVEKNTFWKDEYVKERSKSPLPESSAPAPAPIAAAAYSNGVGVGTGTYSNVDSVDAAYKKPATPTLLPQQTGNESNCNNNYATTYTPSPLQQQPISPQQQQPTTPRTEFRSVAAPQSPAISVYTRQTDSPQLQQQRATESPFRFAQQQQQQQQSPQQQRAPAAVSPLAQQQLQQSSATPVSAQPQAQTVPWRMQRNQQQQVVQPQQQSHPQPIFNNLQAAQQQQQQRSRDVFSPGPEPIRNATPTTTQNYSTQSPYQASKPTNVGSLYIAPLSATADPQAQHIVRQQQQLQQQQQARDSPMRQLPQQQQQQQQQLRWLSSQPATKEQAPWARGEENGNVLPSSLRNTASPQPQQLQQPAAAQPLYQLQVGQANNNGFNATASLAQNFGSNAPQVTSTTGLRLQINNNVNANATEASTVKSNATNQSGPRERIIPITLEQTPTYAASQPNFGAPAGHIIRSANQFVDQGYNNYPASAEMPQQWREPSVQCVLSPTQQNAPRIQQHNGGGTSGSTSNTRIIPISLEGGRGGPISASPVVLQNDPRSPPIQSKSFRILQKITDTVDDGPGSNDSTSCIKNCSNSTNNNSNNNYNEEPQLQRPKFARQMSAQQARNSPTIEQMRRMQIAQDQQQQHVTGSTTSRQQTQQLQGNAQTNRYAPQQQRSLYEMPQNYVPPSEQQVPEPKKYTGSAIPSRSFKILQAMTTPENADKISAELDSDLGNVELNENNEHKKNNNNKYNQENVGNTYSSNSSLNSDTSATPQHAAHAVPRAQSVPPHYPYAYAYPYPWYPLPPPAANGEMPPPPPYMVNWPYPYPYPPPPSVTPHNEHKVDTSNAYSHYPYYYPYFLPPPPPHAAYAPHAGPQTGTEQFDTNSSATNYAHFAPSSTYPYPVAPSYSQSSTSSRASSVLPDIIITPSTDDAPSQVIMQHHINVEKREPRRRAHSVEIEEVASKSKVRAVRDSAAVIDMLSDRLSNICKIGGGNTQVNLSKDINKSYAGEQSKEFGTRSPSDNSSPVQITAVSTESEMDESDSDSSSDDEDTTPKHDVVRRVPLQAIKSVTNVRQAFTELRANTVHVGVGDEEDEEDNVTTADGESDVFDEEEEDEGEVVEELELDASIEEYDKDDDAYIDDLSVIYEEESELERSSDYAKTVIIKRDGSSVSDATIGDKQLDEVAELEEHSDRQDKTPDDDDDDEASTSVTVRLPLKFSFSRDEKIATVEVGNSQIEERRNSLCLETAKRNSFSIAQVESDSDDGDGNEDDANKNDDCEVSVTISLNASTRSNSLENNISAYKSSSAYPVEEMAVPLEEPLTEGKANVSTRSLSLNMRNKFLSETSSNDVTNNIANLTQKDEDLKEQATEELDFFATLRATKLQAQKMMEKSQSYWGKSTEKKVEDDVVEQQPAEEPQAHTSTTAEAKSKSAHDMEKTQKMLDSAKNSFWSTFEATTKEADNITEVSDDVDFWAKIAPSKERSSEWTQRMKTVTHTQMVRENAQEIEYWTTTLHSQVVAMPQSQRAEVRVHVVEEEDKTDEPEQEDPEDFWASIEQAKKSAENLETQPTDFWSNNEVATEPTIKSKNWHPREEYVTTEPAEDEIDFWENANENDTKEFVFDPAKYPEEPREVDTDEEIDFWAEIEAKQQEDDDEVTFHKSATFWARQERRNSVDETPYQRVEQKPFPAKLPDAEPSVDINIWAALEAARGVQPFIVDPVGLDDRTLVEEFNTLANEETAPVKEDIKHDAISDIDSVHEPVTVHVWAPKHDVEPPQSQALWNEVEEEEKNEHDFWADIEKERETKEEFEEAEQKRNNYRKAMAFFNTSIDEHKDHSVEKFNREENTQKLTVVIHKEDAQDIGHPEECRVISKANELDTLQANNACSLAIPDNEDVSSSATSSSSESTSTPTNFETKLPDIYIEPKVEKKLLPNGLPDLEVNKFNEERKVSVRDRINIFEAGPEITKPKPLNTQSLSVESYTRKSILSRNNSSQRSESEMDEDDSGVTDMNKHLSETDTESESFPELRKMTSYQRAATHSRLFKLLQDENDLPEGAEVCDDELDFKPSRRKIVHNVSITRKQNPHALADAETMTQRRERLSLPLRKNISIDADNPSTPNSPASPIMGYPAHSSQRGIVSDKLVNELVQSLLLKSDSTHLHQLPMEKLQAAAKRALEEEMDSLENTSVETTPAPTPNGSKQDKAYADYYNTWSDASGSKDIVPSKSFRALHDAPRRSHWTVRCPRVLSSKTINRDLARVTESPEIATGARSSKSPECFRQSRERSMSSWRKV